MIPATTITQTPSVGMAGPGRRTRGGAYPSVRLLDLPPKGLWNAGWKQSFGYLGICFYLMIEYVRPQQVYEYIDVLPWGEFALGITLIGLLFEPARNRATLVTDVLLGVFCLVVVLSSFAAYRPSESFQGFTVVLNWVLLYYLTTRLVNTEVRLLIFFLTFMVWNLKMSQHGTRSFVERGFAFASWGATGGPGWFHNSGEFAIEMCIFLPMALHFILGLRHRWSRWKTWFLLALFPGTAFISLVATSSRGGQLGGAAVLLFVVAQSKQRWRGLTAAALLLPALWFVMPPEQKARFDSMGTDETSTTRLTYWEDGIGIMNDYPLLGVGYENWLPYYHDHYNLGGELPHNIFVEAGSELGYSGLLTFLALIVATFVLNHRTRRLASRTPDDWGAFLRSVALGLDGALVGYMVSGFFVTVLFYPYFWMNLSFTAATHLVARRRAARAGVPAQGRARRRKSGARSPRAPLAGAVSGGATPA